MAPVIAAAPKPHNLSSADKEEEPHQPPSNKKPKLQPSDTEQALASLKQRFNALHALKYTEPESQLHKLQAHCAELTSAHEDLVTALKQEFHHETQALLLKVSQLERAKETQDDTLNVVALLDTFKLLTGMHVALETSATGSVTVFNAQKKSGVKIMFQIKDDVVVFSPGSNCKKYLKQVFSDGPKQLSRNEVPGFMAMVSEMIQSLLI